ncbi:ABC-F family ATP-binding cassette domain-containing protein [soil metagenome]
MLRLSNICKYFGDTLLFDQVSLEISEREKVGVVGANGSGKSTLLKIIAGLEDVDDGHVRACGNPSTTYLPQHMDDIGEISVGSYLAQDWFDARRQLSKVEQQMQNQAQSDCCSELYKTDFEKFEKSGGYTMEEQLKEALSALNIPTIDLDRRIESLSGGEKTKVALARLLLTTADLMLLDEPTNNLDRASMEWLEQSLMQTSAACIIVSHDRNFLDRITSRTLEIDQRRSRITSYSGNYSWYKERKRQEQERQLRQFKEQQIKIKRLTEDIRAIKNQALATEKSTQNDYLRGRSKKVAAKAKARQARLTRIIELEKVDTPRFSERPKFSLSGHLQYSSNLIEARDLNFYGNQTQLLLDLNFVIVGSARIAITGDNGSGKSTLLKLIVGELTPHSGSITRKPGLRLGHLPQNHEEFESCEQTVLEHFKSLIAKHSDQASNMVHTRFNSDGHIRTLLNRFQFAKNDVFKDVRVLSRGERTKLILASFMASDLDLLVMDEPTNHLDLATIESFEEALKAYQGALLVVSHDQYFLEELSTDCIWHVTDRTIKQR